MSSGLRTSLIGGLALAEGLCGTSALLIWLLKWPWPRSFGDALFFEGAGLLVLCGAVDLGRSVTFSRVRGLRSSTLHDAPPEVRKPRWRYVLLTAGLLLCVQGAAVVYLFPA